MDTRKLAGIIIACTIAIIVVIVTVLPSLMPTPTPDQPPIPDQPSTSTPTITKLVDQTLVVPIGIENQRRLYFSLDRSGVVRGTIEVVKGESISYFLYEEPAEAGWTEAKGIRVVKSNFEVHLDPGWYYLIVSAGRWDPDDTDEERTVSVYLEFEG